ncbi:tRNA(Ile)-lysidine synthase [Clostridium acetobutylicum]|uniref:tRNA(Ile)-lysidine synthase n=1 Tax=Clostridium acetobutylicum (strain ATCC 824 / DSM 792 / JCM 1419 / IAM 19013 / LMG 5710 / NBRC 13948 / NRRL B-527 / VKM B-1787 / 2291 / W) TaxID=272562 RepID=TILS_CLOAB|nr:MULTISPECIES: tRNA lysidine(34) synthetase TilS [Clostridium]Q97EB0.1 RecName: Full=tRNA(Ile)-lysidine synthase; AltName: Full=tRNA(Ile)-2-lysyl-cytidine synthase; AltName: Full=tRNA(Ile)-lysidine synthetase [Clostridium acetobutylicum ATCC 824]AAK81140.1 Cell cycle protein MesJ ortholog, ATPase of the PP-loop superamily [Clostridium acetobutylicum ATCC 824]ADZ22245.1 ATPase of the PP-loop superamily [Clostridium acetobutylicum EA 2018]AEI32708.1 cell cycle protein MesJ-like protein [Clostri
MINDVINTIEKNSMIKQNDRIVVAVSGGPDSICLLHILFKLKDKFNTSICAAHVNHCIRGEAADKDEEYVKKFCEKLDIQFYVKRVDVNKIAHEKKISSEMAGREIRYAFFEEVKERFKANKIAIAHNANDQAETIMMRIIRGTGTEGIKGIRPVRDGYYIRPLIEIRRSSIEKYCEDEKLMPRIDATNLERDYNRNKIRLDLIPYIVKNFNEDIVGALNRLGELVTIDNDYLEKLAKSKYKLYCNECEKQVIISKEAFSNDTAILSRIIRRAVFYLVNSKYNLEKKHIDSIIGCQKNTTGKQINLPNNMRAYNNYGDICLRIKEDESCIGKKEYNLHMDKLNSVHEENLIIGIRLIHNSKDIRLEGNKNVKYFDADKAGKYITLRYRSEGDKFMPFGMKNNKKLKDIFINLKIPREERNKIPLICFGGEIAWITGFKISEKFKIDNNTKKILEIKIEREE